MIDYQIMFQIMFIQKIVKMIVFFALGLATITAHRVDGVQRTMEENFELETQLNLVNKLPIKSIQSKFGYIVDCFDSYKQPAFDHPLLKNHKLQRKPSFQKSTMKISAENSPDKPIFELQENLCPKRTIPIRRTTKNDLIRIKSLLNNHILTPESPGTHVAEVSLITSGSPYYGVGGTNSIYNPIITKKNQTTSSHIWVQNGNGDGTNKIMVGWHVSPELHGDNGTYIYSYWTSDNSRNTGCYNLHCSGFFQTDKEIYLGGRVAKTSVDGGGMVEMKVNLTQDPATSHWWLNIQDKYVGYFPAALFSNLTAANKVGWGGRTTTLVGAFSPAMGSGHFPSGNFVHSCYFRYVLYQDSNGVESGPEKYLVETFTDNPKCYGVEYYGDLQSEFGYSLQFGGPGGDCGN